jgi:predicted nicotinamide N-methyase
MDKDERQMNRAELALLSRIRKHFDITQIHRQVAGIDLAFTQIRNPDLVLDQVAAQADLHVRLHGKRVDADQLHLPYWAEFWDSALGIGQLLVRRRAEFAGQTALDLGCGMGLAGAVAARIGMKVLFADLEPPALLFARLNSLPDASRVRTRQLNWQTDRLDERFDLVLGADILYERKQWDFLEPFWRAHLNTGGAVLLGEPGRQTGDLFVEWIATRGWSLAKHTEPVTTRPTPIRILELRAL